MATLEQKKLIMTEEQIELALANYETKLRIWSSHQVGQTDSYPEASGRKKFFGVHSFGSPSFFSIGNGRITRVKK